VSADGGGDDIVIIRAAKCSGFFVVKEKAEANYSAYSPDLPGCVSTGTTREKTELNMHEAIKLHTEGMIEDQLAIHESHSYAEYLAVAYR
jgi:predicted RNase H-like HicB family nuclease